MNEWKITTSAYKNDIIVYRYHIINHLINKYQYKKYLEIGVGEGNTFNNVEIENKTGVDPNSKSSSIHTITSDEFFDKNTEKFDIIFIDGLHLDYQVDKDIINSISRLNTSGSIVLHDCNPPTKEHGTEKWILSAWNGTVWKSIVKLRCTITGMYVSVVDIDWGCGIIQKGNQILYDKAPLEECLVWKYFDANRKELLNLISTEEFISKY